MKFMRWRFGNYTPKEKTVWHLLRTVLTERGEKIYVCCCSKRTKHSHAHFAEFKEVPNSGGVFGEGAERFCKRCLERSNNA